MKNVNSTQKSVTKKPVGVGKKVLAKKLETAEMHPLPENISELPGGSTMDFTDVPLDHPAMIAQQIEHSEPKIEAPVINETPAEIVVLKDKKAEKRASKAGRKFVLKVTGAGMGRSRFITPASGFDPWKFHAMQYDTYAEAKSAMLEVKEDLADNQYVEVEPFDKAWFESPEEIAAKAPAPKKVDANAL